MCCVAFLFGGDGAETAKVSSVNVRKLIEKLQALPEEVQDLPATILSQGFVPGETTNAQFKGYGRYEQRLAEVTDVLSEVQGRYEDAYGILRPVASVVRIWA